MKFSNLMFRHTLLSLMLVAAVCHRSEAVDVVVRQVADLNPNGDSNPYGFTEFNDLLFFGANGEQGEELYLSNGDVTELVEDINPFGDSAPSDFVEFNNQLYFTAAGPLGRELYRYDGFTTNLVADVAPQESSSNPRELTVFKDWLYFSASAVGSDFELFRTNGTATERISVDSGIVPTPSSLTVANDDLYFAATGTAGIELYRTDGSTVSLAADVNPNGNSFPNWLTPYEDGLVFWANVDAGLEPYELDGDGVRLLADINPGPAKSSPNRFTEFDGKLYFGAHDGSSPEVFRYDGEQVSLVQDLNPNVVDENEGFPFAFDVIDDQLFVSAFGPGGLDLYSLRSEGSIETLELAADTNPSSHSFPVELTEFADDVFFIGFDEEGFLAGEPELFQLNDGETRAANSHGVGENKQPTDLIAYSGELFFPGTGDDGNELYKASLAGDANEDGRVDFADFLTFTTNFSESNAAWEEGDFNLDGEVGFPDFLFLSLNFGARAGADATDVSNVPEPHFPAWLISIAFIPFLNRRISSESKQMFPK